jgi:hypothetical protein
VRKWLLITASALTAARAQVMDAENFFTTAVDPKSPYFQ